jgi:hypothetical protein
VLCVRIRRKYTSSLFCVCSLSIAIEFTVLDIRVLRVNMEEPLENEPNVRGSHKQKGKVRVTARDTLSGSNILTMARRISKRKASFCAENIENIILCNLT